MPCTTVSWHGLLISNTRAAIMPHQFHPNRYDGYRASGGGLPASNRQQQGGYSQTSSNYRNSRSRSRQRQQKAGEMIASMGGGGGGGGGASAYGGGYGGGGGAAYSTGSAGGGASGFLPPTTQGREGVRTPHLRGSKQRDDRGGAAGYGPGFGAGSGGAGYGSGAGGYGLAATGGATEGRRSRQVRATAPRTACKAVPSRGSLLAIGRTFPTSARSLSLSLSIPD